VPQVTEGNGVLLTNHVLSGALIGALARRPLPAFAAGVASHFVLDAVPHWGDWDSPRTFLRVAVPDGLISLALIGAFAAACEPERRLAVVAGMAGAALPDADKPTTLWFGWSPVPATVDRFHSRIQREAWGRFPVEVVAAGTFAAAALTVLRRGSRRPRRAGTALTAHCSRHVTQSSAAPARAPADTMWMPRSCS
jgi:hypothetical protein